MKMQKFSESKMPGQTSEAPATPLVWVGLDWADQKHCAVVRPPAGAASRHWIEQKAEALDAFFLQLHQEHPGARLAVCLEQARGPVIYALLKYEFVLIYPINPRSLADFRRAFALSGAKSDERDADLLCEFGCKHHERLRPIRPEDPLTRQLRLEVEARRDFVDERTALTNQLTAALKAFYPLVLALFGDGVHAPLVLEFLRRWPNLRQLKGARPAVLRAFFYKHNSRSEARIEERLEAIAQASPLTEDAALIAPLELKVQCLVRQIAAVEKSIAEFEARIECTFKKHSAYALAASLPGAGRVLGPRLAALFGTRRENWADAGELQRWTGVAPVRKQSGHSCVVQFRRARPRFIHQTLIEFAKCSIPQCDWARVLYEHQLSKGKSRFAAIRTVAFKWLRILFRCWQKDTAYDETKYLQSLRRRGINLYASLYANLPPEPQATT
jgi:transposase